jgi:hypothetical protein
MHYHSERSQESAFFSAGTEPLYGRSTAAPHVRKIT